MQINTEYTYIYIYIKKQKIEKERRKIMKIALLKQVFFYISK